MRQRAEKHNFRALRLWLPTLVCITAFFIVDQRAFSQTPQQAIMLNNEGIRALQQGNFLLATQKLELALQVDPSYQLARDNLSVAYNNYAVSMAQTNPQLALTLLKKAFALNPNSATTKQSIEELSAKSVSPASPPATSAPSNDAATNSRDVPVKDKWAVVIGVSKFRNPAYNLRYSAKDAQDFYNYLVQEAHFRPDHIALLLDEQATRENILTAFGSKWLPNMAEPGDLVVIYVSTHGTPANRDNGGRNYIVAHDTDADNCYATGVDMDELTRRIKDGVKTDRALVVLDTCYSGGAIPGARSLGEYSNFDLANLPLGRGHMVISSSSNGEKSWESRRYENGVFTKNLIQSLRTNGDVKSAYNLAKTNVEREVRMDDAAHQTPQIGGDWEGSPLVISAIPTEPREVYKPFSPSANHPPTPAQPAPKPPSSTSATTKLPPAVPATHAAPPKISTTSGAAASTQAQPSNKPAWLIGTWQCDTLGQITFTDLGGGRVKGVFHEGANAQGYFEGVITNGVFNGVQSYDYFGEKVESPLTIKMRDRPYLFRADFTLPSGRSSYYNGVKP